MIEQERTTPNQVIQEHYTKLFEVVYKLASVGEPAAASLLLAKLIKIAAQAQIDILPLISAYNSAIAPTAFHESEASKTTDLVKLVDISELKIKADDFEDQFTILRKNKRFTKPAIGRARSFLQKNVELIKAAEGWHILPEVLQAFASCKNKKELRDWDRENQIQFNFDQTGPEAIAVLHEAAQMLLNKHHTAN